MRLVDAGALLKKVKEAISQYAKHGDILRLCADVKEAVMKAPTIEAEPKWIPVTERLPEWMEYVIVHYENGFIRIAMLVDDHRFSHTGLYGPVTHWMPLPAPPAMD